MTDFSKYNMRTEFWSYDKLAKLDPVIINRDTEMRLAKVSKRLEKKYLPTHSIIIVGRAVKAFDDYRKNEMFRLDGNTRFDVYQVKPELIPKTPFLVIIIDIDNWKDVEDIYYSIDSDQAVEKSNEKLTGLLRYKDYDAKSDIIKKGQFKRAIDIACRYGNNSKGVYLQTADMMTKLDHYWDVLAHMDKLGITNMNGRRTATVLACLLMVGKKHGTNRRFDLLFNNLKNGLTTVNNSSEVDGVHYVYSSLFDRYKDLWSTSNEYSVVSSPLTVRMLYGFDMFMKNKNIPKKQKLSQKNLQEFFQYYNERV